jgi:plasmid stabilization system protein ParE
MGKKIIWSNNVLAQLEDIHFYIFFESKSIQIADKVIETIFDSTEILMSP